MCLRRISTPLTRLTTTVIWPTPQPQPRAVAPVTTVTAPEQAVAIGQEMANLPVGAVPEETALELAFLLSGCWFAAASCVLVYWSLFPSKQSMRLRDALQGLAQPLPEHRVAYINRVAKWAHFALGSWITCALSVVWWWYIGAHWNDTQRRFMEVVTAIPLEPGLGGHTLAAIDLSLWSVADPSVVWAAVPPVLLALVAKENIAEFAARHLSPREGSPADAAKLRSAFVRDVVQSTSRLSRGIGPHAHILAVSSGITSVFSVVLAGLGGDAPLVVLLAAYFPMCVAVMLLFASVNGKAVALRRRVSHLGSSLFAPRPGAGSIAGEGASARPPSQDSSGITDAAEAVKPEGASSMAAPLPPTPAGHALATLAHFETALISATPYVGVSVMGSGVQVFTYQLAESFVGGLLSLLVLVVTRA